MPQCYNAAMQNVRAACVISVRGEVLPCVLMDPVLSDKRMPGEKGPCHYIFKGQRLPLNSLFFGSIETESLTQIWYRRDYSAFRDLFAPRTTERPGQVLSQMPQCCVACYKRLGVTRQLPKKKMATQGQIIPPRRRGNKVRKKGS